MISFPKFLRLPNEIKLYIIETTDPEDIENFALSCKTVFSLSGKTLGQHKSDKAKWSHPYLCNNFFDSNGECPQELLQLHEFATNKRLHRYPSQLTIYDRECLTATSPIGFSEMLGVQHELISACREIFKDLSSPYMSDGDKIAWFHKLISVKGAVPPSQNRTATVNLFILAFLPNVRHISINHPQPLRSEIASMIRHISRTNQDAPLHMKNRLSLTKLSSVEMDCIGATFQVPCNNGILEALLTLPSVQVLRLSNLEHTYKINKTLSPTPHANLTELHFVHCSITSSQISTLLAQSASLRVFSYDHATDTLRSPHPKRHSLGLLLDLVLQHARSTLTYLNCTTSRMWRCPKPTHTHRVGAVGSFRGFEKLSTMRLSRAILLEDINKALPQRLISRYRPKKLVDELPASLEELELVGQFSPAEAQFMFSHLLELKHERLPNLNYVAFHGEIPFADETVRVYEQAGIVMDWKIQDRTDKRFGNFYKTGGEWIGGVECGVVGGVGRGGEGGRWNLWS